MKDKEHKLTCFSESPIVSQHSRILWYLDFFMPLHILHFMQSKFIKNSIGVWCFLVREGGGGGCTGRRFFFVSSLRYAKSVSSQVI